MSARPNAQLAPAREMPAPLVYTLTNNRTGEVILTVAVVPAQPGLSEPAVRTMVFYQARRQAAAGKQVLVTAGDQAHLYDRRGHRVPCAGCKSWTLPAPAHRATFCKRCRRTRAERARKQQVARSAGSRAQLKLELGEGEGK